MKKLCILLSICLCMLTVHMAVFADDTIGNISTSDDPIIPPTNNAEPEYAENQIVLTTNYYVDLSAYEGEGPFDFNGVQITDIEPLFFETTPEEIAARIQRNGGKFTYCITLIDNIEEKAAVDILLLQNNIISASLNYRVQLVDTDTVSLQGSTNVTLNSTTNTTTTSSQWAHNTLEMETVWSRGFIGDSNITVAVLDSGFVQNADFENNFNWDLAWDVYDNDNDVTTTHPHGTYVSAIIGSDCNDNVGIDGICKNITIIPVKIAEDNSGSTYMRDIHAGAEYAVQQGADIINLSYTMPPNNDDLRETISSAGVLFVTSSDNETTSPGIGKDMALVDSCIGKCNDDPYWIVVGASNTDSTKRKSSHYSNIYCDLFAPGSSIKTINTSATVVSQGGTSMASPHVAAACALIMSHATHLTPLQVKNLIMNNVTEVSGFDDYCVSGGILNILNVIDTIYSEDRGQYGDYTKGDINNNGTIDARDYLLAKRIYHGTYEATPQQLSAADIDGDGTLEAVEYLRIQRYYNRTYYFPPIV